MRSFLVRCDQPKTKSVSLPVGDTAVGAILLNLLRGFLDHTRAISLHLVFPTNDAGVREQPAQIANNFLGRDELREERAIASGDFARFRLAQFAGGRPFPDFSKSEIAHGGGVENRVHLFLREQFKFGPQIGRGVETNDPLRLLRFVASRVITVKQSDLMSVCHQEIAKLRSEFARGEIGQSPDLVERFISRPGCYNAVHQSEITGIPRNRKKENVSRRARSKRSRERKAGKFGKGINRMDRMTAGTPFPKSCASCLSLLNCLPLSFVPPFAPVARPFLNGEKEKSWMEKVWKI